MSCVVGGRSSTPDVLEVARAPCPFGKPVLYPLSHEDIVPICRRFVSRGPPRIPRVADRLLSLQSTWGAARFYA